MAHVHKRELGPLVSLLHATYTTLSLFFTDKGTKKEVQGSVSKPVIVSV